MCEGYSLKWLDSLIAVSLDPRKTDLDEILPGQINYLQSKIEKEKTEQQSFLKNEVFSLLDEKKITILVNQYHSALIILLDQALENKKKISVNHLLLEDLFNELIACIEDLLSFVELRFRNFIEIQERVSATYLSRFRKEVKQKTERLGNQLENTREEQVVSIILNYLHSFCDEEIQQATFQQVLYLKVFLKGLETLETPYHQDQIFTKLDRVLIYLNFNSKDFINYLIQKIGKAIDASVSINDKIDHIQFYFKEFKQLRRNQGTALFSEQPTVDEVLSNWFTEEIFYYERKLQLPPVPLKTITESSTVKSPVEKSKSKILCSFSTDQIAIVLRALDELQVIKARSISAVFKAIVPHLSTPFKVDLSYDAVRSKSYAAEERDKKIVIEMLQDVIAKIKRY